MATSVFDDKNTEPTKEQLAEALGTALPLWQALSEEVAKLCPGAGGVWKYPTKAAGWVFVDTMGKRNLLYRSPGKGWACVTVVLGQRAAAAALAGPLPEEVKRTIREAKPYVEGRGILVEMRGEKDVENIVGLLRTKLENS